MLKFKWADEKSAGENVIMERPKHDVPRKWTSKKYMKVSIVLLSLLGLGHYFLMPFQSYIEEWHRFRSSHTPTPENVQDFATIKPSTSLEWHDCYEIFKCARLTVPMDYNRPSHTATVSIALVMLPGVKYRETGQHSVSPLIFNPGGPGGSGVKFLLGYGVFLQQAIDLDYDLVSFDPRGVGATTPRADCFSFPADGGASGKEPTDEESKTGAYHRLLWLLTEPPANVINSTQTALSDLNNRASLMAEMCRIKDEMYGEDSIFKHVGTPTVAHDMISIIDAWAEWQILSTGGSSLSPDNEKEVGTKGKLFYWGFSYGTLLGATFAAMFPDRVGRVLLDGVVDADAYTAEVWKGNLVDIDQVEASFWQYCHQAEKKCDLYRDGDKVEDVRDRYFSTLQKLKNDPIKGIHPVTRAPVLLTWDIMRKVVFQSLYFPSVLFPPLAMVLDAIDRDDGQVLNYVFPLNAMLGSSDFCGPSTPSEWDIDESQNAIMCSDKRYPLNQTVPELEAAYEDMSKISSYSDVWLSILLACNSWSVESIDPPLKWNDHPAENPKPINTSFPLLFISNTADPVTPLVAGIRMAHKFVDAGLVEQLSEGHCSISSVSLCTLAAIRSYLGKGVVPSPPIDGPEGREIEDGKWMRCPRDDAPWKQYTSASWYDSEVSRATASGVPLDGKDAEGEIRKTLSRLDAWASLQKHAREYMTWGRSAHGSSNAINWAEMIYQ